jgi:hypothetical protein
MYMEALGLLFVGTTLFLLIWHVAEVFGEQWSAGNNSVWRRTLFRSVLAREQRNGRSAHDRIVLQSVRRNLQPVCEPGLELRYVLETHVHVVHTPPWRRAPSEARIPVTEAGLAQRADELLGNRPRKAAY